MKKNLIILGCALFLSAAASAQTKGDMTIGGNLGFGIGSHSWKSITKVDNTTTTSKDSTPSGSFSFIPSFGYFVVDNLQLNVGLGYEMSAEKSFDDNKSKKTIDSRHRYTLGLGLNYFIKVCNNFYYTPGFFYDFGGVSSIHKVSKENETKKTTRSGFTTGFDLNLVQFEVKVSNHCGLTLNLLNLEYDFTTTHRTSGDIRYTQNSNDIFFNLSSKIGFKYYF